MKRRFLAVLAAVIALITLTFGAACNVKDGINGTDGKDGVGISDAYIDDNGDLIIILTDGTKKNCGNVKNTDDGGTEGLLYTEIKSGEETIGYSVSSLGTASEEAVAVPSYFRGKPVLEIGEGAFKDSGIKSITLSGKIEKIGVKAFYNCKNLSSITIGSGIKQVGSSAFSKCENLENVNLTDVGAWCNTTLGNMASSPFYFADKLYINGVLATELVIPDAVTAINDYAFYQCSNITGLTVGNGVTAIGSSAFGGCKNLKSVTLGANVTSIGDSAFLECSSLENLVIGENVKLIDEYAFTRCAAIKYLSIPASVEVIGDSAFSECSGLAEIKLNYGLKTIGDGAFVGCVSLESFIMPDSVTSFGVGMLMFQISGVGFEEIGSMSNSLTRVVISDKVTEIPDYAFSKSNILSAVIGRSVERIRYSSFYGCNLLKSVVIPRSVKNIQSYAFFRCEALDSVFYEGTEEEWERVIVGAKGNDISNAVKYFYSAERPEGSGNFWHYADGVPVVWE